MLRKEFIEKLGEIGCTNIPTDEEYVEIEFVYTYYPMISETNGQRQIAELYNIGGITLIRDMCKRAEIGQRLYNIQQKLQRCQEQYQYAVKALTEGCALDDYLITRNLEIGDKLS